MSLLLLQDDERIDVVRIDIALDRGELVGDQHNRLGCRSHRPSERVDLSGGVGRCDASRAENNASAERVKEGV